MQTFRDQFAERIAKNFQAFKGKLPSATIASYFRALWNGIPTSRRMATCSGFAQVTCDFSCSPPEEDSLEHYCRCRRLRSAMVVATPVIGEHLDDVFGVRRDLTLAERLACANKVRVACRAIQLFRNAPYQSLQEVVSMEWNRL